MVLLTPESIQRQKVLNEIGMACATNRRIIPLMYHVDGGQIPDIIKSEEDREAIMNVYGEFGIPTDQLQCKPFDLRELTEQYNKISHSNLSAERLIRELIRLRKPEKLPRVIKRR